MKRAIDKESSTSTKKTKIDHEIGQTKLILPVRPSQERREMKTDFIAALIRPQIDTEPIVLSSDDEDDIMMQKSILAKSLNVSSKNTPLVNKADSAPYVNKKSDTPLEETGNTVKYIKNIKEHNNNLESISVKENRIKGKGKQVEIPMVNNNEIAAIESNTTKVVKSPKSNYKPGDVASAMDISNLDEDETEDDDIDVEGDYEDEDRKEESEPNMEAVDSEDGSELNLTSDVDTYSKIPTSTTLIADDMLEIDELQSDTDADDMSETISIVEALEKVKEANEEPVQPMSDVETTNDIAVQLENVHSNRTQRAFSKNRPVREGRNVVNTYNDVANSIDPEKLNYVSSDSEDDNAKSTTITVTKKPRSSLPKTMRAAVVLSKFTKELTSRRHLKTGFVYDTAMSYHATPNPMEIHPEDPRRIFKIFNILEQHGLLQECERINSRRATKEEILLVHNIIHYRKLRETADLKCRSDYMAMENDFDSIYLNSNSFESGLYAVGSLINLMEAVIADKVKNAFAIIRPPGHHAESDMPMGFCLFNNVAIATRDSMKRLGVNKTLIVDWDVHFGNGTQVIFSEDPNVLYVSLHRYEDGAFYPSDKKGSAGYIGHGEGEGKTLNIPWPCAGMTDADYLYAFEEVIMPIAREFGPDVVVVSAGFDAAINDPIGKCNVTPAGYGQMTHMLKSIAHGKLIVALEGGYDLNSIAVSALACMNVLLGDAPEPIDHNLIPKQECIDTIKEVKTIQKKYWNCLS